MNNRKDLDTLQLQAEVDIFDDMLIYFCPKHHNGRMDMQMGFEGEYPVKMICPICLRAFNPDPPFQLIMKEAK